jgi:hypothetical protein
MRLDERTAFTAALLGAAVILLADALSLSPTARLVPLVVLVPTLALVGLQLLRDLSSPLDARLDRFDRSDRSEAQPDGAPASSPEGVETGPDPARRRREAGVVAWIGVLLALTTLAGLLAGLSARCRFASAAFASLAVLAGLYGLFMLALRIPLFEGLAAAWIE